MWEGGQRSHTGRARWLPAHSWAREGGVVISQGPGAWWLRGWVSQLHIHGIGFLVLLCEFGQNL